MPGSTWYPLTQISVNQFLLLWLSVWKTAIRTVCRSREQGLNKMVGTND